MAEKHGVACLVMAAGNGVRFGANKLMAEFHGKPLIEWALNAIPEDLSPVAVVTQYAAVEDLSRRYGYQSIRNTHPELGVSHTIRLGVSALAEACEGILFLVADQPLLRQETVRRLAEAFRAHPDCIVCPRADGVRGNPCVFPADLFPALKLLEGDRGGIQVIRRYPERVLWLEVPPEELKDVDSVDVLKELEI